jgi:PAS domain S-box-containing protein
VSAQEATEERLRAREEQLRVFVEHSPAAVAMFDREMRYLLVSRRYAEDYRLTVQDLVGRRHYDVFPEIPERWREIHRRALAGAVESCAEDPFPRADGTTDWVRWELRPWRDDHGEIGGVILFSEVITERKRAEERLVAERERLAVTLRSIADAVIATDEAGRVTVLSEVAEALTGWPAAEAVGRPLAEVFRLTDERTRRPMAPPAERALREGTAAGITEGALLVGRDGAERPIVGRGAPIRGTTGAIRGVVLVFRDRTAEWRAEERRHQSEERLAASERRYRLLADHVHDVIWVLDLATARYSYVSPSIQQLRGLTVEEALAEPIEQSLTPESLARARAAMAQIGTPEERDPLTDVYDQPCRDGTLKHVEITTTVVRDPAGRPVEVVGVSRDATARVEAQRALEESEGRYRSLFQLAPSGVVLLDEAGAIVAFNDRACEQLGYAREEFARLRVGDLDVKGPEVVAAQLRRIAARGADELEVVHRARSGELRNVLVSSRHLVVGGRSRFLATWLDVTERRRAQDELRRLEEQIRQAQKLESVGRLAGGVAHDFNNLLTVILGCTSELEEAFAQGRPASLDGVREIDAAARRAAELTGQLLAFARKQAIAPVRVDLGALVRGSERMLRRILGEDVDLRVEVAPGLWPMSADPGQITQLIMNLAVNARDAMPTGGTLLLQTFNSTTSPEHASADPECRPGDWIRLVIRDSGAGMTAEVRAHLFEPFFTTKELGKGTGLGLAMVYGIVKQAGGHIHVASEPGRGTTFEVCFPRETASPAEVPPPAQRSVTGGSERILVVEDEPLVRAVIVRTLQDAGYDVLALTSGREALALPRERTAEVELLVTDVVMPAMDGRVLARELRLRHPELPVLFLSGYAPDTLAERGGLGLGFEGELLPKPFTAGALLSRVRTMLDRA